MKLEHLQNVHYLKPAEVCFAEDPLIIKTILGSCISVTMYSQRMGAAAVCHALLPSYRQDGGCLKPGCEERNKYVDCIIPEMVKFFQRMNIDLKDVEVKLFGGADMFEANGKGGDRVGSLNVNMAREVLKRHGLRVTSYDVGGRLGRKILFDTRTGEVWMKRLNYSLARSLLVKGMDR